MLSTLSISAHRAATISFHLTTPPLSSPVPPGSPLLTAMYGPEAGDIMAQIVVLQVRQVLDGRRSM